MIYRILIQGKIVKRVTVKIRLRVRRDDFDNSTPDDGSTNVHILKQKLLRIYAINYNVLRIMSGHAGLAFRN